MCEIISKIWVNINKVSGPQYKRRPKKIVKLNKDDIKHILNRDNFTCKLTGNVVQFEDMYKNIPKYGHYSPSFDRIDSNLREYSKENVSLVCYKANSLKRNNDHITQIHFDDVDNRAIHSDSKEGKELIELQSHYINGMNRDEQKQQEYIWKTNSIKNKKGKMKNMNENKDTKTLMGFLGFLRNNKGYDNTKLDETTSDMFDYISYTKSSQARTNLVNHNQTTKTSKYCSILNKCKGKSFIISELRSMFPELSGSVLANKLTYMKAKDLVKNVDGKWVFSSNEVEQENIQNKTNNEITTSNQLHEFFKGRSNVSIQDILKQFPDLQMRSKSGTKLVIHRLKGLSTSKKIKCEPNCRGVYNFI